MAKTLEELKAENLAEEQQGELDTPTDELDGEEAEADELDEEHDETGESDDADADDESAVEDWMQSDMDDDEDDDGQSSGGGKFDDSDMANARRKYKAKIAKRDSELEELRKQVEELRQPKQQPVQQGMLSEPRREDFESADDPDVAYTNAMIDYRFAKQQAEYQAQAQTTQRQAQIREQNERTSKAVDAHYERAVELATKSGITPELYQSADYNVRQMVETVYNPNGTNEGAGDAVVDSLIASLGEGSEKVMYNLGRNKARLAELRRRFEEDPSGVKASIYIGQLNAELNAPKKRTTNAPKPAPQVQGDKVVKQGEKALKRAYEKADKAGDAQARFNARREARKAGIDTSNW